MLLLTLIPALTLVTLVAIFMRTQFRFRNEQQKIRANIKKEGLEILAKDSANDEELLDLASEGSLPPSKLLQTYRSKRKEFVPELEYTWDKSQLNKFLKKKVQASIRKLGNRLMYRTMIFALLIVTVSLGVALACYQYYSRPQKQPQTTEFVQPNLDPFPSPN